MFQLNRYKAEGLKRSLIIILLATFLFGCNDDGNDNNEVENGKGTAFSLGVISLGVESNNTNNINLAPYLVNGAKVVDIYSNDSRCDLLKIEKNSFTVNLERDLYCIYSAKATTSDQLSQTVPVKLLSTVNTDILTPISAQVDLISPQITLDLDDHVFPGYSFPQGYQLHEILDNIGGTVEADVDIPNNTITINAYTEGYGTILYSLVNVNDSEDFKYGSIEISVSDSDNIPPNAWPLHYNNGQPITPDDLPLEIDLLQESYSGQPLISDPDSNIVQLVYLNSLTTQSVVADYEDVNNTKLIIHDAAEGHNYISYAVADHRGGYTSNIIDVIIEKEEDIIVTNLVILPSYLHIYSGDSAALQAYEFKDDIYTPVDGVEWSSDDESIAQVGADGVVMGISEGETEVTGCKNSVCDTSLVTVYPAGIGTPEYRISGERLLVIGDTSYIYPQISFDGGNTWVNTSQLKIIDAKVANSTIGSLEKVGSEWFLTALASGNDTVTGDITLSGSTVSPGEVMQYSVIPEDLCWLITTNPDSSDPKSRICFSTNEAVLGTVIGDEMNAWFHHGAQTIYVGAQPGHHYSRAYCEALGGAPYYLPGDKRFTIIYDNVSGDPNWGTISMGEHFTREGDTFYRRLTQRGNTLISDTMESNLTHSTLSAACEFQVE